MLRFVLQRRRDRRYFVRRDQDPYGGQCDETSTFLNDAAVFTAEFCPDGLALVGPRELPADPDWEARPLSLSHPAG